jgi:hypothetical protein
MKYLFTLLLSFFVLSSIAQKQKVIFDCDLGGDIDDAFAVALLLTSQNEFEIMGFCMEIRPGAALLPVKCYMKQGLKKFRFSLAIKPLKLLEGILR